MSTASFEENVTIKLKIIHDINKADNSLNCKSYEIKFKYEHRADDKIFIYCNAG